MLKFDIVIVGNGILAYSTAYALLKKSPEIKVGIVGNKQRIGSATTAAGAMLGCFGEVTKSNMESHHGQLKHQMSIQAMHMWPAWVKAINEDLNQINTQSALKINQGTFVILNAKSGELDNENYSAILKSLQEHKEPYFEVDPKDIPGFSPIEDSRALRSLLIPNEGSINPLHLLTSLEKIFRYSKSVEIIDANVSNISLSSNNIHSVHTSCNMILTTNHVLIAAGAYSQTLIDKIPELRNRIPPIFSGVGSSLLIEQPSSPITQVIRTPNRAGACGLHTLPQDKHLYLGATNNLTLEPETLPTMSFLNFLIQCGIEQISQSFYASKIISWNVGNRPATLDSFPLIGKTSITGIWVLSGTYRDGLHYSPFLATEIAAQILGEKTSFGEKNPFLPERKPIQTMTKEQAINEAVHHYVSGAYEHDIKMPRIGWNAILKEVLDNKVRLLYEKLETNFPLPPDVIIMLDNNKGMNFKFLKAYLRSIDEKLEHPKTKSKKLQPLTSQPP